MRYIALIFYFPVFLIGCKGIQQNTDMPQGISGTVLLETGNRMPSPGAPPPKPQGVKREVLIYKVVTLEEVGERGPIFKSVPGEPVASVTADEQGKFSVGLPPGTYSLFTKEEEGLFANSFDGQGRVFAVDVIEGKYSNIKVVINYNAAY